MPNKCSICGEPILTGQPRYVAGEWRDPPVYKHWDCHEKENERLDKGLRKQGELGNKIADLLKRMKF